MKKECLFLMFLVPAMAWYSIRSMQHFHDLDKDPTRGGMGDARRFDEKALMARYQKKKPSAAEMEKAKQACMDDAQTRGALKAQAQLDVKNPTTSRQMRRFRI